MKTNTDYYDIDNYLTEEQLLIRSSTRAWVNKNIKPNICEL